MVGYTITNNQIGVIIIIPFVRTAELVIVDAAQELQVFSPSNTLFLCLVSFMAMFGFGILKMKMLVIGKENKGEKMKEKNKVRKRKIIVFYLVIHGNFK